MDRLFISILTLALLFSPVLLASCEGDNGTLNIGDIETIQEAAANGNIDSMLRLWDFYSKNENFSEGKEWLAKAAHLGNAEAQAILGHMFMEGEGVPANFVKAYVWLSLAKANNDKSVISLLEQLEMKMTAEQIGEAQKLSSEKFEEIAKNTKFIDGGNASSAKSESATSTPSAVSSAQVQKTQSKPVVQRGEETDSNTAVCGRGDWSCSTWGNCVNGIQIRDCSPNKECESGYIPEKEQSCVEETLPDPSLQSLKELLSALNAGLNQWVLLSKGYDPQTSQRMMEIISSNNNVLLDLKRLVTIAEKRTLTASEKQEIETLLSTENINSENFNDAQLSGHIDLDKLDTYCSSLKGPKPSTCDWVSCGKGATYNMSRKKCECLSGYFVYNNECTSHNELCGPNAIYNSAKELCDCESGYIKHNGQNDGYCIPKY